MTEAYKIKLTRFLIGEIKEFYNVEGYMSVKKLIINPRFEEKVTHWMNVPEPPSMNKTSGTETRI